MSLSESCVSDTASLRMLRVGQGRVEAGNIQVNDDGRLGLPLKGKPT